ncbi:hypothetical protein [Thalassotalea maritima]|uniref:hypothetical protein n=1 Tax=Thalassotalea maritima TaxID=3242416 RepID=UPI003527B8FD
MTDKKIIHVGSTLEKAQRGEYTINVSKVLKEGWALTKVHKMPIVSGLMLVLLIGIFVSSVIIQYMGGVEAVQNDPQAQVLANLLATIIIWPFLAGIEMMGLSHAVGIKTRTGFVFAFLKRSAFVAIAALIISSLSSLGFMLILPGIYIAVAQSLTIPLLIEKNMSPMAAIIVAFKATRFQWLRIFQIYCVLFTLLLLALVPAFSGAPIVVSVPVLVIALVFLGPYFYNVKGILYREIFGISMQVVDNNGKQDTYFSA